ncbi:MAG: tetratricopeptide repeat protein [Armatimonadota bacterium]
MIKLRADVVAGVVSTTVLCGAIGWIWWREPQRLTDAQLVATVTRDPKNAEAFTELANRQEHAKNFEAAMASYLGAGKAGMGANSYAKAARCALKAGFYEDALRYARDAVDMEAGSKVGTAATMAAGVFVELGDPRTALSSLPDAKRSVPFETDAIRAKALLALQRYPEALDAAEAAVMEPTSGRMAVFIRILRESGDTEGAYEVVEAYGDSADAGVDWHFEAGLARTAHAAGNTKLREQGEAALKKVIQDADKPVLRVQAGIALGQSMLGSGRADDAIPLLLGLTKQFPQSDEARYVLACARHEAGDLASAGKALQQVANRKATAHALRQRLERRSQRFN